MKLSVNLPDKAYDLLIEKGKLETVGNWVSSLWEKQKIVIITDDTVNELYGKKVEESIKNEGFEVFTFSIKPGEKSKSLESAEKIYHFLAEVGMTRKDGIIILGGGVVGDLGGFVASTYMRGLHFLQIPTTLLAQVDSSIGGKTAVNTLLTLENRRIKEGLAEVVKSAAIADIKLWELLETIPNEQEALNFSEEIIYACCNVKRKVVEEDEKDVGIRLILNFGHTIGHAVEQTKGYGVVTHGEAVSIGMCQITKQAEKLGTMPNGTLEKLTQMLEKFHLPTSLESWDEASLYEALTHDKKTRGNKIRIILLETIGQAKIETIDLEKMKDYLKQ
jgi:3-dehydroquinate synthase